jgi:hypothetical protein
VLKKDCTVNICWMNVMNTAHIKVSLGPPVFSECRDIAVDGSGVCVTYFSTFDLPYKPCGCINAYRGTKLRKHWLGLLFVSILYLLMFRYILVFF